MQVNAAVQAPARLMQPHQQTHPANMKPQLPPEAVTPETPRNAEDPVGRNIDVQA
jgi:hypothetical protein